MAGELLKSRSSAFTTFLKKNIAIVSGLVVLCVVLSFASPYFLTKHIIMTLLRQISTNAILTLGMMMCIMIGGIDLSLFCGRPFWCGYGGAYH